MALAPGELLSHYRLVEQIGRGGMGVVYRAVDTRLHRDVAIKVLSPEFSADADRRARLEREARAAAALNHPGIAVIHDVGEERGIQFLVMELVQGRTLAEVLPPGGMPLDEFLALAVPLADAVSAAHERGIVHRDLKPGNIMVSGDGRVKVLDFGLARWQAGSAGEDDTELPTVTRDGTVMGTYPYMSPEQVQGKPLDPRSDIFSLGTILHEMATGVQPFQGETTADLMSSILRDTPPPVTDLRPDLPRQLGRIIAHCLEKKPRRRLQTAIDLYNECDALRRELQGPGGSRRPRERQGSIAVLPFTDMSPQRDQGYLCDGLAEDIIHSLSRLEGLRVAARTSAFSCKSKGLGIRQTGDCLDVASVLEGSVQKAGERLRISVKLINVDDGYHVWSERYDRTMEDVFAVQDEIAAAIVEKLEGKLVARGALPRHPGNVEAYQDYLKGRFHWNRRTESSILRGIDYFQAAVDKAPDYVLAHVGLADSYDLMGFYNFLPPKEAFPRAKAAARKALAMDETQAEAHVSLGYAYLYYDWDWERAEGAFRRAIELKPDYPVAHQWYANLLPVLGRGEEALQEARRSRELDPLSLIMNAVVGWASYMSGDYDQAVIECRKVQELDRTFVMGRLWCGYALLQKGSFDEAIAEYRAACEHSEDAPFTRATLAHGLAVAGRQDEARRLLAQLEDLASTHYVPGYLLGLVALGLGELDRTFERFEQALEERSHYLVFLDCDVRHAPLRGDPRYAELVRRVGLPRPR